ncbi:ATPase [Rhizobiales bacterium]|uniref:ATP12 family chaperone protein n=1 Tax=Hongsoonwoonella zoysiae TaxID=2821844 RepID=UPI00156175D3|nr:ATP12 family protein [Hongsoonwoonella zoysiae]NRG19242.1 ATPase [Hongsoonwoonella zoysiae]
MRDILQELHNQEPVDPVKRARELARQELPKRFYRQARAEAQGEGFAILLDGRPVKTPGRNALILPSSTLAEAIASEWDAQETHIDPARMHLTRLANTCVDGVSRNMAEVADSIAAYAGNDLVCYRAESPESLVERQTAAWDPAIKWAEGRLGGKFRLAGGLMPIEQDAGLLKAFRSALDDFAALELGALHVMTSLTGSALLPFAVAENAAEPEDVWQAAHIDEDWNIEQWGEDEEASARRAYRKAEFDAAVLVLREGR